MKWNVKDIEVYEKAREYVDTILVPLVPIAFDNQMQQMASSSEYIAMISMEVEKKFKGRIFLNPMIFYVKDDQQKIATLKIWEKEWKQAKFKYIFFLTSDDSWEKEAKDDLESFVFIPLKTIEHLDKEQVHQVIINQSQLLIDKFTNKWKN